MKNLFNIKEYMTRKGTAWQAGLSDEELDALASRLESIQDGHYNPVAESAAVAQILRGSFHDDDLMNRIVLETMGRFGSFDEVMQDGRLREGNVTLGKKVVDLARDHYNTAVAVRLGLSPEQDDVAAALSVLDGEKHQWLEGLTDYQVIELSTVYQKPAYPSDVADLVAPYFKHPELLPELVKQSVQDMHTFAGFMQEAREWGQQDHLDSSQAGRVRRCYHTLLVQGMDLDVAAELDQRTRARAETVEAKDVVARITGTYSNKDHLPAAVDEAVRSGTPFREFLQELRGDGDLKHLPSIEAARLKFDYNALVLQHERSGAEQTYDASVADRPGFDVSQLDPDLGRDEAALYGPIQVDPALIESNPEYRAIVEQEGELTQADQARLHTMEDDYEAMLRKVALDRDERQVHTGESQEVATNEPGFIKAIVAGGKAGTDGTTLADQAIPEPGLARLHDTRRRHQHGAWNR